MEWNPSVQLCIWLLLLIKSRAPVCWMRPVVLPSRRWTVCSCEFKRVGERLFPEQSWSWLRHSNPYAPNHTAELSARGYNQGNTSKMSLGSWSASHQKKKKTTIRSRHAHANIFVESLTNCAQILKRVTHNEGAIRSLYRWLFTQHSSAVFGICKRSTCCSPSPPPTWCPDRWDDQWASCPPECQYLPSPPFCQPFQLLIYAATFLFLLAV